MDAKTAILEQFWNCCIATVMLYSKLKSGALSSADTRHMKKTVDEF